MSLRETSSNSIHITDPWKAIEVKTHTIILRDDMEVGTSNHIQVFYPGEDLSSAPLMYKPLQLVCGQKRLFKLLIAKQQYNLFQTSQKIKQI